MLSSFGSFVMLAEFAPLVANLGVESEIYIMKDGLLYLTHPDQQRLCVPNIKVAGGRDNLVVGDECKSVVIISNILTELHCFL